jgi:hypothetical protein
MKDLGLNVIDTHITMDAKLLWMILECLIILDKPTLECLRKLLNALEFSIFSLESVRMLLKFSRRKLQLLGENE